MQRGPLKKAGLIEQQADNDDRNERARGVPDNLPDHRNITDVHHAGQQRQRRTDDGTPANAQPLRLPDDQYQRQDENRTCQKHTRSY